ncbi:flavodoxin family protein [Rhodobacteraceae bacterium RKSG542]|uniref:NAD(P)H-dependent oxidoreductase n=1 Tax=Pseudovibrio flavus TaxID=2529854 RepID=UPI0012BB9C0E|nr:NAD(P)H-dependent oxidoreductase [Pseudovibrio flavus]MTI18106.1 flavodoxin family protein [Pseudovibrio flavus]
MKKVLVLFAHPRIDRSETNSVLAKAAASVQGVKVIDLYREYPTFEIDVAVEQQRLLDHDIVVFQHPLYWYSTPAILKEWQDLVLEYKFAYGAEGDKLKGKVLFNAVTCGARRETYSPTGAYTRELIELLAPFQETARLCQMEYLPPFALFGSGHAIDEGELEPHVKNYITLLSALVEDQFDYAKARDALTLSEDLQSLLLSGTTPSSQAKG